MNECYAIEKEMTRIRTTVRTVQYVYKHGH
jgi:hypothetical protein